jgi:hypothetical protein
MGVAVERLCLAFVGGPPTPESSAILHQYRPSGIRLNADTIIDR